MFQHRSTVCRLLQPYSYSRSYRQLLGKSPKRRNSRARHGLQIVPVDHGDPLRRCGSVKKTIPHRELGWNCWPCTRTRLSFYLFCEIFWSCLTSLLQRPGQHRASASPQHAECFPRAFLQVHLPQQQKLISPTQTYVVPAALFLQVS